MEEYSRSQSAKRTNESSPAIYRWDNARVLLLSPRSGRLNSLSLGHRSFVQTSVVRDADSRAIPECEPSTEGLGYSHSSASRTLRAALGVFLIIVSLGGFSFCAAQTAPPVLKVEPASWWVGSSVNPVRLLIRGSNLTANVQTVGPGWRVIGRPKTNELRTYLFVDVAIAPHARPGPRKLLIATQEGMNGSFEYAPFEILAPLKRANAFGGF
jgi:hypothetical protein